MKEHMGHVYWKDIQELFKHHYDVHGLIEAGLAIDVNSI